MLNTKGKERELSQKIVKHLVFLCVSNKQPIISRIEMFQVFCFKESLKILKIMKLKLKHILKSTLQKKHRFA